MTQNLKSAHPVLAQIAPLFHPYLREREREEKGKKKKKKKQGERVDSM